MQAEQGPTRAHLVLPCDVVVSLRFYYRVPLPVSGTFAEGPGGHGSIAKGKSLIQAARRLEIPPDCFN
jgi:hypothetical protein